MFTFMVKVWVFFGYLVRGEFDGDYLREHVVGAMDWLAAQYNQNPNTWGMRVLDLDLFYDYRSPQLALFRPAEV
jgi:hypothetical protein